MISDAWDLATATGGRAIVNTNNIDGALRMAVENRAYYLLGYEPAPPGRRETTGPQDRVTTKSPGVECCIARSTCPGVMGRRGPELIASPLPVRDLRIRSRRRRSPSIAASEASWCRPDRRRSRDGTEVE